MSSKRIRLLALDGGGVRGLSSLVILKRLMETVDRDDPPKPCEYFSMIGGTSTGGLLAILLGRLEMSIDDCISTYTALSDKIFERKRRRVTWRGKVQGRFSGEELERAIKNIVASKESEDSLLRAADSASCKVFSSPFQVERKNSFVCATSKETCSIVNFTSYPSRGSSEMLNATRIWEAARATAAASSLFDPIKIGPYGEEFVDGATGACNPIRQVWQEARIVWPDIESDLERIVSIGTGVPLLSSFGSNVVGLAKTLIDIATETESTAESFRRDHPDLTKTHRYFRFNVDRGLEKVGVESFDKKPEIIAATNRYLGLEKIQDEMVACARGLVVNESRSVHSSSSLVMSSSNSGEYKVDFSMRGWSCVNRFVPRNPEIEQIEHSLLPSTMDPMRRKVFVLSSPGGMGKTQMALEYARKHQKVYTAIFLINGDTEGTTRQSFADIARRLPGNELPAKNGNSVKRWGGQSKQPLVVNAELEIQISQVVEAARPSEEDDLESVINDVLIWLSHPGNDQWLLIFDNVDRPCDSGSNDPSAYDVEMYFPHADHGSILIASRLRTMEALGSSLGLQKLSSQQSQELLGNRLGAQHTAGLDQLASLLDGMPLALAYAGSYIKQTNISVGEYISLYRRKPEKLFDPRSTAIKEYSKGNLFSTWQISYDHVQNTNLDAAKLLALLGHFDHAQLWYELLTPSISFAKFGIQTDLALWYKRLCGSKVDFLDAVATLSNFSFLEPHVEANTYSMHPVIHQWCFSLHQDAELDYGLLAVAILKHDCVLAFKEGNDSVLRRLLPHCDNSCAWMQSLQVSGANPEWVDSLVDSCISIADVYREVRKQKSAIKILNWAIEAHGPTSRPQTQAVLRAVVALGDVYFYDLHDSEADAESLYQRVLRARGKILSTDHSQILQVVRCLGMLYIRRQQWDDAEKQFLRLYSVFSVRDKDACKDSPQLLRSISDLGFLYECRGDMTLANSMNRRFLDGFESALEEGLSNLGPCHYIPYDVIVVMQFYLKQKNFEVAETMRQRVLIAHRKLQLQGVLSAGGAFSLIFLAVTFKTYDRVAEAEELGVQALSSYMNIRTPHTELDRKWLYMISELGDVYRLQGKVEKAEKLLLDALNGYEEHQRKSSPDTTDPNIITTLEYLGKLRQEQGNYDVAEEHFLCALRRCEADIFQTRLRVKVELSNRMLFVFNALAELYWTSGQFEKGKKFFQDLTESVIEVFGPDHELTKKTAETLWSFENRSCAEGWPISARRGGQSFPDTLKQSIFQTLVADHAEQALE